MTLTLQIFSFSYKDTVPSTQSNHGGGFVFDCRCVPNPGRIEEYKQQTGLDTAVQKYLQAEPFAEEFWQSAVSLVNQAVSTYLSRDFDSLLVAFGCTGGQHRSVFFAERLAATFANNSKVTVVLEHLRRNQWPQ